MENAIMEVRQWPKREVQLYHHNDSDGLSSGAILTRTFERAGFEVQRFCLEKPYPALLQKVYEQEGGIIVFADFAGRIAPMLSDFNKGRNLTLILDHHVAEASTDPKVHNLDPDLYGLKGDRDIAGATTCYLFAHTWNRANRDLAYINQAFAAGSDELVVYAQAGPDACVDFAVMDYLDRLVARLETQPEVLSVRALSETAKSINAGWHEGNLKWAALFVLLREGRLNPPWQFRARP